MVWGSKPNPKTQKTTCDRDKRRGHIGINKHLEVQGYPGCHRRPHIHNVFK